MNDYSEFDHGINAFQQIMRQHIPEDEDSRAITGLEIFKNSQNLHLNTIFICSFTCLKDSLSQWRAYASDATGVGIGINTQKLNQFCSKQDLPFGSVLYDDSFKQVFANFSSSMMPIIEHVMKDMSEEKIEGFNKIVFAYLTVLSCFMKHLGFKEECEIRIIAGSDYEVKHKFHKGLYVPYVEVDFDGNLPEMIDEIWIGPAANQELAKRSVGLMLKEFGMDQKCNIKTSEIPFRLIEQP